ncbi:MAG: hypothetical protein GY953_17845 [bacterium]|nr:hypothetical protein [bacterium]
MQPVRGQTQWTPEWEEFRDEQTGTRVIRLTSADCVNHPLYYLTNSFAPDCRSLVFASNRTGKMDLFQVSLADGVIRRLTDLQGLQPFSGNLVENDVYFSTGEQIHRLNQETLEDRVIADVSGAAFGEVTLNSDREWAAALITVDSTPAIMIVRTDGSKSFTILEGAHALYHPQFHPRDPDRLIYSADLPDPRLWTVRRDGSDDRCVYRNRPDEWFTHETFLGRTGRLILSHFHHSLTEVDLDSGERKTIAVMPAWHIAADREGKQIVCDTHLPDIGLCLVDPDTGEARTLCHPKASNQGSQWRQEEPLAAGDTTPGWQTMAETETTETAYGPQWSHPHPSFSPDGRWVAFTSDVGGQPQAYVVET